MIVRCITRAATIVLAAFPAAADTSWRCVTIEVCEGLSCTPDNSYFAVDEQSASQLARVTLQDGSFAVPFAGEDEGLLDDAPYSERRYVEQDGNARASIVVTLRNPSDNRVGVSIYWPEADVASSREIIGRCLPS